jgi:hypothetical protein
VTFKDKTTESEPKDGQTPNDLENGFNEESKDD